MGAGPAAPTEALAVASELLEAGDADAFVVVAVDHVGPVVDDLWGSAGWALPERGAMAAVLGAGAAGAGLEASVLAAVHCAAVSAGGSVDDSTPGWPALRAALRRLS